jgi:hypothetical protein
MAFPMIAADSRRARFPPTATENGSNRGSGHSADGASTPIPDTFGRERRIVAAGIAGIAGATAPNPILGGPCRAARAHVPATVRGGTRELKRRSCVSRISWVGGDSECRTGIVSNPVFSRNQDSCCLSFVGNQVATAAMLHCNGNAHSQCDLRERADSAFDCRPARQDVDPIRYRQTRRCP